MAIYPTTPLPVSPVTIEENFRTIISDMETGAEFKRSKNIFSKRGITLNYEKEAAADAAKIYNFYRQMKGAGTSFYITLFHTDTWDSEYIGKGSGSNKKFIAPISSYTALKVYKNGAEQTITTHYTVSTDNNGFKNIDFESAPALDDVITTDFTGIPQLKARFASDNLSRDIFVMYLQSIGVRLIEDITWRSA